MALINEHLAKEQILKSIEIAIRNNLYMEVSVDLLYEEDIPLVLDEVSKELDKILENVNP